jgi:hypothetical protein
LDLIVRRISFVEANVNVSSWHHSMDAQGQATDRLAVKGAHSGKASIFKVPLTIAEVKIGAHLQATFVAKLIDPFQLAEVPLFFSSSVNVLVFFCYDRA